MSLNAKNAVGGGSGGGSAPILEPGAYPARVAIVAGLGVQAQQPYQGQEKDPIDELFITYELVDEFMKDEDGNDIEDKPRWQSERFPFYNLGADKAKSTKRYVALDPELEFDGDWTKMVGKPCLVTLSINKSKSNGKEYNNVANVSAMRDKDAAKAPALVNDSVVFDFYEPDLDAFNALPEWVQNLIKEGVEFKGSKLAKLLDGGSKDYTEHEEEPEKEGADDW